MRIRCLESPPANADEEAERGYWTAEVGLTVQHEVSNEDEEMRQEGGQQEGAERAEKTGRFLLVRVQHCLETSKACRYNYSLL